MEKRIEMLAAELAALKRQAESLIETISETEKAIAEIASMTERAPEEVLGRNSYGRTYYGVVEERLREADFLFASEARKAQLLEWYGTMGNYITNYWTFNARKEV